MILILEILLAILVYTFFMVIIKCIKAYLTGFFNLKQNNNEDKSSNRS